jgi:hypothetical protein
MAAAPALASPKAAAASAAGSRQQRINGGDDDDDDDNDEDEVNVVSSLVLTPGPLVLKARAPGSAYHVPQMVPQMVLMQEQQQQQQQEQEQEQQQQKVPPLLAAEAASGGTEAAPVPSARSEATATATVHGDAQPPARAAPLLVPGSQCVVAGGRGHMGSPEGSLVGSVAGSLESFPSYAGHETSVSDFEDSYN